MKRIRVFLCCTLALCVLLTGCGTAQVDNSPGSGEPNASTDYPSKTIEVILPVSAGGDTDLQARKLFPLVEETLGETMIINNMPGGASAVGLQQLAQSSPDGYTLLFTSVNHALVKAAGYADLTYEDFEVVCSCYTESCQIIIRGDDERYSNYEEFVEYAKSHPGELTIGTGAAGGVWHLAAIKIFNELGVDCEIIGSNGGAAGVGLTLLNGDIDAAVISSSTYQDYFKSGEMKLIATCAPERESYYPDVPTLSELGLDVQIESVRGILAPKGTPDDVLNILESAFETAVNSEEYADYCHDNMAEPLFMNSEEYTAYCAEELELYSQLVVDAGLSA